MNQTDIKILSKSVNGQLYKCSSCNQIHIEFKNFLFAFNSNEYIFFRNSFINLDPHVVSKKNKDILQNGKLKISLGHKNMIALFSLEELQEIKQLLGWHPKYEHAIKFITSKSIISQFSEN